MPKEKIVINDVGPRDGLQNQKQVLSVAQRVELIQALVTAKVPAIEVGAFVSPKAVPAMANTAEVIQSLPAHGALYSTLIPNKYGYELAKQSEVELSSLVLAVSSTMNEKNIGMNTQSALSMAKDVLALAKQEKRKVQAYVATAWACPFEGQIQAKHVVQLTEQLLLAGASDIVIADTIGAANPKQVKNLMKLLADEFGMQRLSCHFHDTRAMGLANVFAAVEVGIRKFDASIAGLGGCPFAPGASGNVATEDVVMMLEQMDFDTGIDMSALLTASDLAIQLTGTAKGGNAKAWLQNFHPQSAVAG